MSKSFMPELAPELRLQALKEHCDHAEEAEYYRDLSSEEFDVKMESFTNNCVQLSELEDGLAEIKEDYKIKMKPLKEENRSLLSEIKTRKAKVEGTLFHLADHEQSVMETYDEAGDFVSSRRLRPDEKQQKLFPIRKTSEQ